MVAVISTGHSLSRILRYNEDKVTNGVARVMGEGNCPFTATAVGLMPKLNYMERIAALNTRVTRNSVHISLNFAPEETYLPDGQLLEIARTYMERIGFGKQPWIAYRHLDAGHPHLHLVTLKVRPDGSRIDMQNIGRNQSEAARKEIEKTFNLIPADKQAGLLQYRPEPLSAGMLRYGHQPTKKAIGNIVQFVLQKYRFTSLPELNAVLGLYNVRADQGKVTSRTFLSGGLRYSALDAAGSPVGVPQKASAYHFLPTLKRLEFLFGRNKEAQAKGIAHAKAFIDAVFFRDIPENLDKVQELLRPAGIDLVLRTNNSGQVYGVTYVDHTTFCVLNGSNLGKSYSAKGLQDRCGNSLRDTTQGQHPSHRKQGHPMASGYTPIDGKHDSLPGVNTIADSISLLLRPEGTSEYPAPGFHARKKTKKRKGRQ